jgi:hypothetical protein
VLDVTVGGDGIVEFWHARDVRRGALASETGGDSEGRARVLRDRTAGRSRPAPPAPTHGLISGPLQQGFLAEYELSLREWGLADAAWVRTVWLKDEFVPLADQLRREGPQELASTRRPHALG